MAQDVCFNSILEEIRGQLQVIYECAQLLPNIKNDLAIVKDNIAQIRVTLKLIVSNANEFRDQH